MMMTKILQKVANIWFGARNLAIDVVGWMYRQMMVSGALAFALAGVVPGTSHGGGMQPEQVSFPSLDKGKSGGALTLDGYLFKPASREPLPAVVMFHGCAGAISVNTGRITSRFTNMAQLLNDMGYAVLIVDSFNPRGVKQICTVPLADRDIKNRHRIMDAYGALQYLNSRPDIVAGKVGAIGFSHGGSGALSAMDATTDAYGRSGQKFAAAVAMYPGCGWQSRKQPEFSAYGPLLILAGEKDDWTPVEPCRTLAVRSQQRNEPVELVVYPGAYHAFDSVSEVYVRKDVPNGVNGTAGVHVGANPAAREAAYKRVREFFHEHLGR
ncbi:dienelactone hydrolase family protein [Achromobacter mucicolens]|uniref:dienelactone hydrolase family protein n=1 Tax=Achromobacter mucicolens TaxID=1389922 RepID=UPI0024497394|nr:dienelactone hydrolase family protein [Achromobacter mucicolens]MDH1521048.1 dienelactone hydrolase family protein [Achromobacter mucicolens]